VPHVGARRLGQDEQYLTVREILSEASTLTDGTLSRESSNFYRFGYATLGFKGGHDHPFAEKTVVANLWLGHHGAGGIDSVKATLSQ
jgi:hypothetical protein